MQKQINRLEKKGYGSGGPRRAGALTDQEAVLRELERADLILQSDLPELIDSMTMEEVDQEMKEMGIPAKPLPGKIVSAIRRARNKPSNHDNTKDSGLPETIDGQAHDEAEDEESRPKTRVAGAGGETRVMGAGGSNVLSIDKNKKTHPFVQAEAAYSRSPLIIWTAAVVILAANLGPMLHWLIGKDSNEAVVWVFSVAGAILLSILLTAMIGYYPLRDPRRIVSRSGFFSALALTIGGGIVWMAGTNTLLEATFAATFGILGIAATLYLRRAASAFTRTGLDVLPERLSPLPMASRWGFDGALRRFRNHVDTLTTFWPQSGMKSLEGGRLTAVVAILSAGFLICAASGGIGDWQYRTSEAINTEQSEAENHVTAIHVGSSGPTPEAGGNARKEEIVEVGRLATIVIRLPREKVLQLDKQALADYLKVQPGEIQLIDGSSRATLVIPPGDLPPKESEPGADESH